MKSSKDIFLELREKQTLIEHENNVNHVKRRYKRDYCNNSNQRVL